MPWSEMARMGEPSASRPFAVRRAAPLSRARRDTPLYRLKTPSQKARHGADHALTVGLDPSAAQRVFGSRQATITSWLARAGDHARTLHERFFCHLYLPHVQLDELRNRL